MTDGPNSRGKQSLPRSRPFLFALALAATFAPATRAAETAHPGFPTQGLTVHDCDLGWMLRELTTGPAEAAVDLLRAAERDAIGIDPSRDETAPTLEEVRNAERVLREQAPTCPWNAIARGRLASLLATENRAAESRQAASRAAELARDQLNRTDLQTTTRIRLFDTLHIAAAFAQLDHHEAQAAALFREAIGGLEAEAPTSPQLLSSYVDYGVLLYQAGRNRTLAGVLLRVDELLPAGPNPVALAIQRTNAGTAQLRPGYPTIDEVGEMLRAAAD